MFSSDLYPSRFKSPQSGPNPCSPAQSHPPQWLQAAAAALLPPACREPVLGDLEERFAERPPGTRWLGYLGDLGTTVPHVWRSQMRPRKVIARACSGALRGDLRSRAEGFQTQIWVRNVFWLVSVIIVIAAFLINARGTWHFNETVSLAMTVGWIGAIGESWVRCRSTSVPSWLTARELRAFHRRELLRQRNVRILPYIYWFVPAVSLTLYAMAAAVPRFRGWVLLIAIGVQTCAVAFAYRSAQRAYQRELDQLEQEVEEPA